MTNEGPVQGGRERAIGHDQAREILNRYRSKAPKVNEPRPQPIRDRLEATEADDAEQNVKLRGQLAQWALIGAGVQLLVSDVTFIWYGCANSWTIASEVMITWLTACVLEVVAVVAVIARSLYK